MENIWPWVLAFLRSLLVVEILMMLLILILSPMYKLLSKKWIPLKIYIFGAYLGILIDIVLVWINTG